MNYSRQSLTALLAFCFFSLVHAQEIATLTQSGMVSLTTTNVAEVVPLTDFEEQLMALEATTPLPASQVPDTANGFYSVQNPDWPPVPGDILGLDVWPLGNGLFALDDRNVNYVELQAAEQPELSLASRSSSGMTMMSLISGSGGTPVYLTNLIATPTDGSLTVTFSIVDGTNGFAYDIYSTTNLADWPVYSQWAWLGQGYTTNSYTFTNQPFDNAFYILAIPRQTMVVAWGDDLSGQCDVPSGLTNTIDVAGGYNFSLALRADGSVAAWGSNAYGQTNVPAGLTNATVLAAGAYHGVALKADGTLVQWGKYWDGTNYFSAGSAPTNSDFISVAAGSGHDIGLKADGTVATWGLTNDVANYVPTNLTSVKAVAAGWNHNVALLTNGTVTAWGDDFFGETNMSANLTNVTAIAAGALHSLALRADGMVIAWGYNNSGQTNVPAGLSNVVAIAAGGEQSLALQADGIVVAWGNAGVPDYMTGVKAIAAGFDHNLAVRSGQLTPVILQEPGNQYAPMGGTVTFSSRGAGVADVTYQWQFNAVNITGGNQRNPDPDQRASYE